MSFVVLTSLDDPFGAAWWFTGGFFLKAALRIIPTPWEVTLSRLLSIVSDFEREGHLKYKLA